MVAVDVGCGAAAGVAIVTGDTKVVNRGSADKLFVTTTGMGLVPTGVNISASNARARRHDPLSGTIADHGMAVLSKREGLEFEGDDPSDTRRCTRSSRRCSRPARSTLCAIPRAGTWHALAKSPRRRTVGVEIDARAIPVREDVKGACEMLGMDPLFVANEGKLVAFVAPDRPRAVLEAMRATPEGREPSIIGKVVEHITGMAIVEDRDRRHAGAGSSL